MEYYHLYQKMEYPFKKDIIRFCEEDDADKLQNLIHTENLNINDIFNGTYTPVHYAVVKNAKKCLKMMIGFGGIESIEARDANDDTPLILAVSYPKIPVDCLKILIESGASVNAKGYREHTALYRIVKFNNVSIDVTEILIKAGADVNARDYEGNTPLHAMIRYCYPDMSLIMNDTEELCTKSELQTMHETIFNRNLKFMQILIESGADINAKNRYGNTPLHVAAYNYDDCIEIIKLFVDYGVDIHIKNNKGETFMDWIENETLKKEIEDCVKEMEAYKIKEPLV